VDGAAAAELNSLPPPSCTIGGCDGSRRPANCLCGNGTLATAHVFYEAGLVALSDPIVFETASGPLRV